MVFKNEGMPHFLLKEARAMVSREEVIFGFPIVQAKGMERNREEIKV